MANQGKEHGHIPFDAENCDDIENQHAEEEAMDFAKKDIWSEEEEAGDEPFAVMGETASAKLIKMNAVENSPSPTWMDKA